MEKEKNSKFLKIFIIYFAILFTFVLVRIASNLGVFNGIENEIVLDLVSTSIIQIGILFLLPFSMYILMFKKKPKQVFDDFGYKKLNWQAILICFGIGALAFVLNLFISNFFSIILSYIGYNPTYTSTSEGYNTFGKFLFNVISVAIMPALFEEFVHRGLILRGTSNLIGYKKAIILSSILFGLMHLNISQFFYATILGLLMGLVATMTRSIWPAVIIHFCNNFVNVFISYSETTGLTGFSLSGMLNTIANQSVILFIIFVVVVIVLALIGVFALLRKLFLQTGFNSYNDMFENIEKSLRENNQNMTDVEVVSAFERYIFPNMKSPQNVFDLYINDSKNYGDLKFKYKIPLISCFVLATLITVFTFVWGVV